MNSLTLDSIEPSSNETPFVVTRMTDFSLTEAVSHWDSTEEAAEKTLLRSAYFRGNSGVYHERIVRFCHHETGELLQQVVRMVPTGADVCVVVATSRSADFSWVYPQFTQRMADWKPTERAMP